jgi:hypothetical protein
MQNSTEQDDASFAQMMQDCCDRLITENATDEAPCRVDSFESLFCDTCHNLLYPTRRAVGQLIYMCKVCFQEKECDPQKAVMFFSRSYGDERGAVKTNILPQSQWGFDYTLKRIRSNGQEYVIVLDGNLRQILLKDKIFSSAPDPNVGGSST